MKNLLSIICSFLLLLSCTTSQNPDDAVTNLADDYVEQYFMAYPELAVINGAPDLLPAELSDNSLAGIDEWHKTEDRLLSELMKIDAASVGNEQSVTYGFLKNMLESSIRLRVCKMELWEVSPTFTGWQNELPFVFSSLPIESADQREDAYQRLAQLPDYILNEIDNLREGISQNYTAPRSGVIAVIDQMNALLDAPAQDSPFALSVEDGEGDFNERVLKLVEEQINPAIFEYRDFLQNEYLEKSREVVGVSANPAEGCYAAATGYYITSDFTAEEIHQKGLDQLESIRKQMSEIGERSFSTSDPAEVLSAVKEDAQYRFESRQEMIQYANAAVSRAESALPEWFGFVPEMETLVEPYSTFMEKNAPLGQAIPPSADGSQPGKYIINTYQPETQTKAMLESLSFHEAYPGHVYQAYVALEVEGLHPISSYFYLSGFGEGWALYSERLAEEMDLYTSDVSRVGWLASESHRAARLVVDSGMHALGWTRQESIDYLIEYTTLTPNQAAAETDRYIAVPGQATSYMMGALEIQALRAEGEKALGERFDIKEFHDVVLRDGTVPLNMLRDKVEAWIESKS